MVKTVVGKPISGLGPEKTAKRQLRTRHFGNVAVSAKSEAKSEA
ncbi:hypothetical protein BOH78_4966 [Pichia kudriavzevii]|jgi:hypothetical protein|uniref:Uncharacterized protein n=1 Tax=Pichia kudriavzevii TaxID=4909 RepID=A0A1V2LFP6_PICKU|nr:hypothetical protein BOH78_5011 [Pichia kudriavzevii]ONH70794.1 hypothetical protein BOH78_4966 [Pichia kudriavzevii]